MNLTDDDDRDDDAGDHGMDRAKDDCIGDTCVHEHACNHYTCV